MAAVAEAANVSVFTVSAVVNGTSVVSAERRLRVERAIKAIGYKRNTIARSLKTGTTMTIGVILGDITNPFYTDIVATIQEVLHRAGYAVMLCCNDLNVQMQAEQVALLRDRMVDGLIISPVGNDAELQAALRGSDIPIVLVDRVLNGHQHDAVVLDNRDAVGAAMRYLLSLGHRRVGFISGMLTSFTGRERLAGYEAALKGAGIKLEQSLIEVGNYRPDEAYNATLRLMTGPNPPSALLASNNQMMISVMKAIRDLGLSCPDDVSVIGIDDFPWAEAFTPQLTTVAQPVHSFGEESAHLLLERLTGKKGKTPRHIILKGELKVRGSCRPTARPSSAAKRPK